MLKQKQHLLGQEMTDNRGIAFDVICIPRFMPYKIMPMSEALELSDRMRVQKGKPR